MSRKAARKDAFKLVFQAVFHEHDELKNIIDYFYSENRVRQDDKSYISDTVAGVFNNISEIDGLIAESTTKWDNDRINKIDMAIIRVAVYEILKIDGIPVGVSINEAVELAKEYGTDDSPAFINGVLGAVELRVAENKKRAEINE